MSILTLCFIIDKCFKRGVRIREGETHVFSAEDAFALGVPTTADIIWLIDESRSMELAHAWLVNVSLRLDAALRNVGVGSQGREPNRYGLVGFGVLQEERLRGVVLHLNGSVWGSAKKFNQFGVPQLIRSGRTEDGYQAIYTALTNYDFRPRAARQMILVTDEGRDAVSPPNLTRAGIYRQLNDSGVTLNVVVSHQFELPNAVDSPEVLGIDSDRSGYIRKGRDFAQRPDAAPIPDSSYETTDIDYTQLALSLRGGAWDLGKIKEGGDVAEAFTKAFVSVKVKEVQGRLCEQCKCESNKLACTVVRCLSKSSVFLVFWRLYSVIYVQAWLWMFRRVPRSLTSVERRPSGVWLQAGRISILLGLWRTAARCLMESVSTIKTT